MPRTRSSPAPRSVRHLTHQPKRLVKRLKTEAHVEEAELQPSPVIEEHEETVERRLIRQHAASRAERQRSSLGLGGVLAVVITCGLIFVGWWFLPNPFEEKDRLIVGSAPSTTTTQLAPALLVPATTTSTPVAATSTERRLLIPLTSSSTASHR